MTHLHLEDSAKELQIVKHENEKQKATIHNLTQELVKQGSCQTEMDTLRVQLAHSQKAQQDMEKQLVSKEVQDQEQFQFLSGEIEMWKKKLQEQKTSFEVQLKDAKSKWRKQEAQTKELEAQLQDTTSQLQKIGEKRTALQETLRDYDKKWNDLQTEFRSKTSDLGQQVKNLSDEKYALSFKLKQAEDEIVKTKEMLQLLREKNEKMYEVKQQVVSLQQSEIQLKTSNMQYQQDITRLQGDIQEKIIQIVEWQKKYHELQTNQHAAMRAFCLGMRPQEVNEKRVVQSDSM